MPGSRIRAAATALALALAASGLTVLGGLAPAQAATTTPGTYNAVTPTRLLDTRNGTGATKAKLGAGKVLVLQVGGKGGVPATNVSAVVLNVNAVNPTANGRIIAYADGTTRPDVSSVNFVAGRSGTSLVLSRVSSAGQVALYNTSTQPVDLVADLSGYFVGGTVSTPGGFVPLAPSRSLDTRNALGADRQALFGTSGSGDEVNATWQVAGRNGVPAAGGASAVVLSLTFTNATTDNYLAPFPSQSWDLTGWPDDNPLSMLNGMSFAANRAVTNLYVVPLGLDGRIELSNTFAGSGTFDVIADVVGYVRSGTVTAAGAYQAGPSLVLGYYAIPAGGTVTAQGIGDPRAALPLNATVAAGNAAGALVAYETGTTRPTTTRNVNFIANEQVSNTLLVRTSATGSISLFNSSAAPITVSIDAAGWFRGGAPAGSRLWSSGSNGFSQLAAGGIASWGSDLISPTELSGVQQLYSGIPGGMSVSYALMADGTVRSWGSWGYRWMSGLTGNPLGLGPTTETTTPLRIAEVSNVVDIAASVGGAFFLQRDGSVWATGDGQEGQLMDLVPEETGVSRPIKLPALTGVVSIGRQFGARADGTVVTWDRAGVRVVPGISDAVDLNDTFALRRGGTVARLTPTGAIAVTGLTGVVAINDRYALTSSGTVWRLPDGGTDTLRQVETLTGVTTLGSYGSVALKADGSVWVWDDVFSPTRVSGVPAMKTAYRTDGRSGSWHNLFLVSR